MCAVVTPSICLFKLQWPRSELADATYVWSHPVTAARAVAAALQRVYRVLYDAPGSRLPAPFKLDNIIGLS